MRPLIDILLLVVLVLMALYYAKIVFKTPLQEAAFRIRATFRRIRRFLYDTWAAFKRRIERIRAAYHRWRNARRDKSRGACAVAVAELRNGSFTPVPKGIRRWRMPPKERAVFDQITVLAKTIESLRSDNSPGDDQSSRLQSEMERTWGSALDAGIPAVLAELAGISADYGVDDMAQPIVSALARPDVIACEQHVRDSLYLSLRDLGDSGIEALCNRLSQTPRNDPAGPWFLAAFSSIDAGKHAGVLVSQYATCSTAAQNLLAQWLSELSAQSGDRLLELVAGVLRRLPADARLAHAIKAKLGEQRLEAEAKRWASSNHKGARTVLERMYGYPSTAFGRH